MSGVHECPCGCGKMIPRYAFSCSPSWMVLPNIIKDGVRQTAGSHEKDPHRIAVRDSARKFFENWRAS